MSEEADRIIGLYQRHARAWIAARARQSAAMEAEWTRRFLALLPPQPAVLDIGCGSGAPMARALVNNGCHVTGVDSSPEMIALCRENLPEGTWQVADMRSLSLKRTFDGLLAWNSFFHLCHDDQRGMFPVFRAHVKPHGALMFTSGTSHGVAMGSLEGEPLYHASLDPDEYRSLLAENGFAVAAHCVEDPHCGGHTIWLARAGQDSSAGIAKPGRCADAMRLQDFGLP